MTSAGNTHLCEHQHDCILSCKWPTLNRSGRCSSTKYKSTLEHVYSNTKILQIPSCSVAPWDQLKYTVGLFVKAYATALRCILGWGEDNWGALFHLLSEWKISASVEYNTCQVMSQFCLLQRGWILICLSPKSAGCGSKVSGHCE